MAIACAGTAYYFESSTSLPRYSIKGYLDETDNSVVWWDDQLLEDKDKRIESFFKEQTKFIKSRF